MTTDKHPAHVRLPAAVFLQKQIECDCGRKVTLRCTRLSIAKEIASHIDMGDGRIVKVHLHGYKWHKEQELMPGQVITVPLTVYPTLSKDAQSINWGFHDPDVLLPALYKDEHPNRFPWSRTVEFIGGRQSNVFLEYERRRLCEQAYKRARQSMDSCLRYASIPPYMTD